jgi:hypothetical protein
MRCGKKEYFRELAARDLRTSLKHLPAGAEVTPAKDFEDICGVWGFSQSRFGGPGEKTPIAEAQACDLFAEPRRHAL